MIKKQEYLPFLRALLFFLLIPVYSAAQENARGLPPADNATYIPQLGGLLNKTMHNQYGQKKDLAECVVLRGSSIVDSKISVPAGGLFYASSTSEDARPLMRVGEVLEPPGSVDGLSRDCLRGVTADALLVLDGDRLLTDQRLYVDEGGAP